MRTLVSFFFISLSIFDVQKPTSFSQSKCHMLKLLLRTVSPSCCTSEMTKNSHFQTVCMIDLNIYTYIVTVSRFYKISEVWFLDIFWNLSSTVLSSKCNFGKYLAPLCMKTATKANLQPDYQALYSCNNITTTLIQISRLFYFGFFSKTNHQMMIYLTPIISRSKSKYYKAKKFKNVL